MWHEYAGKIIKYKGIQKTSNAFNLLRRDPARPKFWPGLCYTIVKNPPCKKVN